MAATTAQIQHRRDTAANWTSANPTLAAGQFGIETDTNKLKIGDGSTAWTSLAYFTGGGAGSGDVTGPASAVDEQIAVFDGTTGKAIKDGGITVASLATDAEVSSAISTHAGATDPHGDRAYADGLASNYATAAQGTLADSAVQPGDLGAVATSNSYDDLDDLPTLGSAAATDSGDYATAAQGALADSAAQPADVASAVSTHAALTETHGISAFGATLVDDANAGAARTTLGLGTAATSATGDFEASGSVATHAALTATHGVSGAIVGTSDSQTLTNKTIDADNNTLSNIGSAELDSATATAVAAQDQATWEAGVGTTESVVSPAKVAAAIAALGGGGGGTSDRWIGAGEFIPRVTNGAGIDGEELATNRVNLDYLAFDAGTQEYAQVTFAWPSGFSTYTAKFYWTAASGSGAVVFNSSARCYADDSALDQAMGTAQTVTDTLLLANDTHISSATSAITPAGTVAAGNLTVVQISRVAGDGSDTLAVDARLIGVYLAFSA